jgi:hypothetical protein
MPAAGPAINDPDDATGTTVVTEVPANGRLSTRNAAPMCAARSRMLVKAEPRGRSLWVEAASIICTGEFCPLVIEGTSMRTWRAAASPFPGTASTSPGTGRGRTA